MKCKKLFKYEIIGILVIFALLGIVIHMIVFIIFTFKPPMKEYFKDSNTGEYGIYRITE